MEYPAARDASRIGARVLGFVVPMKRLLAPLSVGAGATRHLIWYLSYQITGEARDVARTSRQGLASPTGRT